MICVLQLLLCLGLIILGLGVLVGLVKPGEALQRIGAALLVLLLGPAVIALLVKEMIIPAASVAWLAAKHLLAFAALILGFVLIAWVVAGVFELYRNRNFREHRVHSGEE